MLEKSESSASIFKFCILSKTACLKHNDLFIYMNTIWNYSSVTKIIFRQLLFSFVKVLQKNQAGLILQPVYTLVDVNACVPNKLMRDWAPDLKLIEQYNN